MVRLIPFLVLGGGLAWPILGEEPYDPCGEFTGPARASCEFSRAQLENPSIPTEWQGTSLEPRPGETVTADALPRGTRAESDGQVGGALIFCSDRINKCLQTCNSAPAEGTQFGLSCYQQCASKAGCGDTLRADSIVNETTGTIETISNTLGETLPTAVGPVSINAPEGYAIDFDDTR